MSKSKSLMQRLVGPRADLTKAFATRQRQALEDWRKCVTDHADGSKIDIAVLSQAGPQIGIPPTLIAKTFADDVAALEEARQRQSYVEDLAKVAAESAKAGANAAAEIEALHSQLQDAIRRRDAVHLDAQGHAYASGDLQRHKAANPRLWGRPEEAISESPVVEEVEQLEPVAVGGPEYDEHGTTWITDDND